MSGVKQGAAEAHTHMPPRVLHLEDRVEVLRMEFETRRKWGALHGYSIVMVFMNRKNKVHHVFVEWITTTGWHVMWHPESSQDVETKADNFVQHWFYPDTMTREEACVQAHMYCKKA